MNTDFIVTIHAFERLEQRFPTLVEGLDDEQQASLVHGEVMDAFDAGRYGTVPPIELASKLVERWMTRDPGTFFVWTKNKQRGYLMKEDAVEGMLVITVIFGMPHHQAGQKIRTRKRIW